MTRIPIVVISDNKLAFSVATTFINLLETKNKDTFYEFHVVVSPDFEPDNEDKIKSIANKYSDCSISFIYGDHRFDNINNQTGYISNVCAYKFCLAELLPQYDKVLYLDTDIVVFDDLTQLYKTDIQDNYIAGVFSLNHYLDKDLKTMLEIPDLLHYVNAGILLFNLNQIRKQNIIPQCLKLIGSYKNSVDQHIFNKICYGHIALLSPKYNVTHSNDSLYQTERAKIAFTTSQLDDIKTPVIYHYTGPLKPWNTKEIKYGVIWLRYYIKSPYGDIPLVLDLQADADKTVSTERKGLNSFLKHIFSIKTHNTDKKKITELTIFGIQIKRTKKKKTILNTRFKKEPSLDVKKHFLSELFKARVGCMPNIDNPSTFNEKLQWLKIYYHDPLMTKCADKVAVRDYIAEKIGEKYLVPCLGVWDNPDDIDFDKLPNRFVLKVNWGSGQNIIVKDKTTLNIPDVRTQLKKWMYPKNNHYWHTFEWPYKDIKPKIIAEEYLDFSVDLLDYKIMCYNGEPKNLFVCSERQTNLKVTFFDLNWQRLPFIRQYPASKKKIECPDKFNDMLDIAKVLSEPFPFVRVDFFCHNDKLYVGELTFFPGAGMEKFEPLEWDKKLGDLLELPAKVVKTIK